MATIKFKKGDEYLGKIAKLEALTRHEICGSAIYGAAEIVADEIRDQLRKLPTDESWGGPDHETAGPRKAQKKGLYDSLGIASLQKDRNGMLNVKIGFDGYNSVRTKKHPNGQPNAMIAAAVNSGTSRRAKTNFIYKAVNRAKQQSMSAMKVRFDADIENLMKEK